MKKLFSLLLFASVSLISHPGTKPVPAKWLHDGRLVVPELNFSISSPNSQAKWLYTGDSSKVDGNRSTAFIVSLATVASSR
jgi:hypothetical protein